MAKSKSIPRKASAKKTTKKNAPKKTASQRRSPHLRIDELEKRVGDLEASLTNFSLTDDLETITFELKFFGGAGGLILKGEGLDDKEVDADDIFNVQQSIGDQTVFVGGEAPSGENGRIEVEVRKGGTILSPFAKNVFKDKVINSDIPYTI